MDDLQSLDDPPTANNEVVYKKDGVFVHVDSPGRPGAICGGTVKIFEAVYGVVIDWSPSPESNDFNLDAACNESVANDWAVVSPAVGYRVDKENGTDTIELKSVHRPRPFTCEVSDLRSFKMSTPDEGWAHIMLMQKDGATHPTLHFHNGGMDGFLETLNKHIVIKESTKEPGLYLVSDPKVAALQKSLNELELFKDHTEDAVLKFFRNPYSATMTSFSKVTNLVFDYVIHGASPSGRPDNEMLEIIPRGLPNFEFDHDEPGFEVITCEELGIRPKVTRGQPLTAEQWANHFDAEGRLVRVDELKETIFKGGVPHILRSEVWKFLLGYYDYNSTTKSRQENKKLKTDDYYRMKLQWKSISPEQEKRFSDLRDRRNLVEKDVNRTDRADPFYAGENNENVKLLESILLSYVMYNFDLGYVQGMSDLLSPILIVMQNEVDAFWTFACFMERVCRNFEMDQQGIKTQLHQLHTLVCYLDAEFAAYLDSRESGNLYFCFRWLLILFKREFRFQEIMRLWEVLWTDRPCKNFHLIFCLAILDGEKKTVMESKFGFTEILKHMNDMSNHIPLEDTLCRAEAIYLQIKESKNAAVREILGLPLIVVPCREDAGSPKCTTSSNSTEELERQCEEALNLQYL